MNLRLSVAVLGLMTTCLAQAADTVPFSAERSWQVQRIGGPAITPDGKTIVAPVTRFDMKENKGLTDLWLWSADGSVQRARTTNPATGRPCSLRNSARAILGCRPASLSRRSTYSAW